MSYNNNDCAFTTNHENAKSLLKENLQSCADTFVESLANTQEDKVEEPVELEEQKPQYHLLGAPESCSEESTLRFKHLSKQLNRMNLLSLPLLYNENILSCSDQIVNGQIFQAVIKINNTMCKLNLLDVRG